jgi:hypothetical protein
MLASLLLESDEREVVRGDLQEAGEQGWRALADVLGLVLRRQAGLVRPWLAACVPALIGAMLLLGFSLSVSRAYEQLIDAVLSDTLGVTLAPGMALLICDALLLAAWLWTSAAHADPAMRRASVVTAGLLILPCFYCFERFNLESVARLCLLLCLPAAIWHIGQGLSLSRIRPIAATLLAIVLTAASIPTWSQHGPWIPNWALTWPAWFVVVSAWRNPHAS